MTTVSVDGQGMLASGRRVVIVGGTVDFTRLAPDSWPGVLDAVKRQGFNTVEAPIVWREHEPRPGSFDFKEGRDLAQFVRLCGERGLWVIVRFGINSGEDRDFAGLPSWLNREIEPPALRSSAPAFLERASKFIAKAAAQISRLQADTAEPTEESCILAVQCEHLFECGDRAQAEGYLGQLHRYIRESGLSVPVLNANNLYAYVDGQIETWCGSENLLASMRQMRVIDPNNPLHVAHLPIAKPSVWGETPEQTDRRTLARRLCQTLAAGSSFTIADACAGSRIGFSAGRTSAGFAQTDTTNTSILDPDGRPGELAGAARRVCLFARHFASVLSAAHPDEDHAAVAIDANGPTVLERRSALGTAVFVFDDPATTRGPRTVELLLRDGRRCLVDPGADGVAWVLSGVSLNGKARLDLCTASAIANVGTVLVCAAPAASEATVVLNGSARTFQVPRSKAPEIFTHEGITVVGANETHLDEIEIDDAGVRVRSAGLLISPDGATTKSKKSKSAKPKPPAIGLWSVAQEADYTDGTADRFAVIDGPTPMENLGVGEGYGWLRVRLKATAPSRKKLALPQSADRVHVYRAGDFTGIIGEGDGADDGLVLPITKGETTIGLLVDNMGRRIAGNMMGERKGVFGHFYETAPFKTTTKTIDKHPVRALDLRSPLFGVERGEMLGAQRVSWSFTHRKKSPLDLCLKGVDALAFVFLNGELLGVIDPAQTQRWTLDQETLNRGKNELELAILGDATAHLPAMRKALTITECVRAVTEGAEWSYAKWEPPAKSKYKPVEPNDLKGRPASARKGTPTWWRCAFEGADPAGSLLFEPTGLSKGQVFINGHNAGRYWAGTYSPGARANGSPSTPPPVHLPAGWLHEDADNELLLFDEHGFSPAKAALVYA